MRYEQNWEGRPYDPSGISDHPFFPVEVPGNIQYDYAKYLGIEDLQYAKVDHHRGIRQGVPEVIYGEGKTAEQIIGILGAMAEERNVLITRLSAEKKIKRHLSVPFRIMYWRQLQRTMHLIPKKKRSSRC